MMENRLNLNFYKGDDRYTDGEIEDTILEYSQKYEDFTDILKNSNEWALLYHLSPIRENLLEWYDFNSEGTLLEIGAGCGALTGLFCRKLKRVVAIDLSKKRSLINLNRNKKVENLEIVVGNFQDIKIEEKFDYVTLIGVFEYSVGYMEGERPFEQMLDKVKKFLKPNGKLIIAIENKYGLKYWSGATEDHTGILFSGIENYLDISHVRTFSKYKLEEMLKHAGFSDNKFYYPMPDYKLPTQIYSDEYLPKKGELRNMGIPYDRDRYMLFREPLVYDSLCQDGIITYFANSYLIISKKDEK